MTTSKLIVLSLCLSSLLPLVAQEKKPAPKITQAQAEKLNAINMELERIQLLEEKRRLIGEITAANPGYHWEVNQQTGQEGLYPDAPKTATPEKK